MSPPEGLRIQVPACSQDTFPETGCWPYLALILHCLLNYESTACITWQMATDLPLSCSLTSDSKVLHALASSALHLEAGCAHRLC